MIFLIFPCLSAISLSQLNSPTAMEYNELKLFVTAIVKFKSLDLDGDEVEIESAE